MMKRTLVAFGCMIFLFGMLVIRLSFLTSGTGLSKAAAQQSNYVLNVGTTRGIIYDCNMERLTNRDKKYLAAVMPCPQAADALMEATPVSGRAALLKRLEELTPFVCEVNREDIYAKGVEVFETHERYDDDQLAVHIVGQIDPATGQGGSGIEKALDEYLGATGGSLKVRYATDAANRALAGTAPEVVDTGYSSGAGVVLTLDAGIQAVAEEAAKSIERGAVVVMDAFTGDIKASVSRPAYNPNDMADALNDKNSPFINRPFYAYSVGSTFKLLVAATALEQGYPVNRKYDCQGLVEVGDQVFHCHNLNGHGVLDMTGALEKSCNPYFITLALQIGGPTLAYKAQELGFGRPAEFAPGYRTQSGNLPTYDELSSPAAVANLGVGQGQLLATPIQMATLISAIANGGNAVVPRLVEGYTDDGETISSHTPVYAQNAVFTRAASTTVRSLMVSVVEEGSGKKAKPETGGAGGKTASAQTGQYVDGAEVVHAWFAGFYPAENPLYTIVVLVEGGDSGSDTACPVFKQIADGIARLNGWLEPEIDVDAEPAEPIPFPDAVIIPEARPSRPDAVRIPDGEEAQEGEDSSGPIEEPEGEDGTQREDEPANAPETEPEDEAGEQAEPPSSAPEQEPGSGASELFEEEPQAPQSGTVSAAQSQAAGEGEISAAGSR